MAKGNKKKSKTLKLKKIRTPTVKVATIKARKKNKRRGSVSTYEHPYPSRYGSHDTMIVKWVKPFDEAFVICEDERGLYVTDRNRPDTGIADPKRWASDEHREGAYEDIRKVVNPTHKESTDG